MKPHNMNTSGKGDVVIIMIVGEQRKDDDREETCSVQTCNVEVRGPLVIMVHGQRWSPGIYRALRKTGKTLDEAWRSRAFV